MDLNEMNADFTTIRKNQGFSLIEVGLIMALLGEPCTLWQAIQLSDESATPFQSESK